MLTLNILIVVFILYVIGGAVFLYPRRELSITDVYDKVKKQLEKKTWYNVTLYKDNTITPHIVVKQNVEAIVHDTFYITLSDKNCVQVNVWTTRRSLGYELEYYKDQHIIKYKKLNMEAVICSE